MHGYLKRVHPCNGTLFSFYKEGNSDMCYNMDKPENIMSSEISQSRKEQVCAIPLPRVLRVVRFPDPERRTVAAGDWGGRGWGGIVSG